MGYDFYFKRNLPPRDKSLRLGAMARKISAARRWSVREVRGSVVFNEKSDGHVKKRFSIKRGLYIINNNTVIYIYIYIDIHTLICMDMSYFWEKKVLEWQIGK